MRKKITYILCVITISLVAATKMFAADVGAMWSKGGIAISKAKNEQLYPQAISDGSGGAIIAWQDDRSNPEPGVSIIPEPQPREYYYRDIYAQKIDSKGQVQWDKDGVAICSAGHYQKVNNILPDDEGGAIVLWEDAREDKENDWYSLVLKMYAQKIDGNGKVKWDVNGVKICEQKDIKSISDGSGGVIIAWVEFRDWVYYLYVKRIDSEGKSKWSENGLLVYKSSKEIRPYIATDGKNGVIVIWTEKKEEGNPYYHDIVGKRVDASGKLAWNKDGNKICTTYSDDTAIRVAFDGYEGVFIVWEDIRRKKKGIFIQKVSLEGKPSWNKWRERSLARPYAIDKSCYGNLEIIPANDKGAIIGWSIGKEKESIENEGVVVNKTNYFGEGQWGHGIDGIYDGLHFLHKKVDCLVDIIPSGKDSFMVIGYDDYSHEKYAAVCISMNTKYTAEGASEGTSMRTDLDSMIKWQSNIIEIPSYGRPCMISDNEVGLIAIWCKEGDIYAQRYNTKK